MHTKIRSLQKYPYICYKDYKAEGFKLESNNSADLIWNGKDELRCEINNQETIIPPNSIVLLNKENTFSCESNELSQIKVLRFNVEIFSSSIVFLSGFINTDFKLDIENHSILVFKKEQTPSIEKVFMRIEELLNKDFLIDINELKLIISNLLNVTLKEKFVNDAKYVNQFGEILNAQFSMFHNVSDYALQLNMKPKNLSRKFQSLGLSNPSKIIKEKLLLEIKQMIVYSNKSIREICFETGFYDPAYFSRFFKKNVGITAQCYRKQYTNKQDAIKMEKSAT